MLKKISLSLIWLLALLAICVYAEDEILLDDCIDLSAVNNYSEGIYASVIDEESQAAYDDDYTVFMRRELTEEWVEYKINEGQYPVFYTYFRQNEEISHFKFESSNDGEVWQAIQPQIKITDVESHKWIPVKYTLKNISDDTRFVRIKFSNQNSVEWSPMLASVSLKYRETNVTGFLDCVNTPYNEATSLLKNLDFISGYNDYEFKPYNNITRAEFAKVNARILNLNINGPTERVFSDVGQNHWACEFLTPLYHIGIICGDENGNFNPENTVTYAEAAKMLVASLGYTVLAEDQGGYPTGYLNLANRLGIFDNLTDFDENSPMCRGDMAQMMYNALEVDILVQTSFGNNENFDKKGTLLSEYHAIERIDGVISGVDGMSIMSDTSISAGTAIINDNIYSLSDFDVTELLGVSVTAYVDKGKNELLYAKSRAKTIIDIPADKYLRLDGEKIYYENDFEKEAAVSVDKNTRIVYNGKYKSRIGVIDDIELSCGFMRIISNNGKVADTIIITEYNTYISQTNGNLNGVINDRLNGALKVDYTKADKLDIYVYGEKTPLNEAGFSKDDVISIALSEDKSVIFVDISTSSVLGTLDYFNSDKRLIRIEGKEYNLTDDFNEFYDEIKIGSKIYGYIDINGRIFAADLLDQEEYAYLIDASLPNTFGNTVELRMISANGDIDILTATDKTKLSGTRDKVSSIASLEPQLIRIRKNDDGQLLYIETADNLPGVIGSGEFSLSFISESCKYYGGAMSVFASKYQIGNETPIFVIPKDTSDINKYKVINKNGLYSDFEYNIRIFDVSDEYIAGAALIYEDGSRKRTVASYDEVVIINDVAQILNSDGDPCLMLSVYLHGEEREIYFDNQGGEDLTEDWLPNYINRSTAGGENPFHSGEVIQYYSDSENHCRSFRMLLTTDIIKNKIYYEKNTGDYGMMSEENYFSELYTSFTKVENCFTDKILISSDGVTLRTIPLDSANIYVYDKDREIIYPGTRADIIQGGDIFVRMIYADATDIIVIG